MYIPKDESLQTKIAQGCHDSLVAGHFGQEKTIEIVTRDFYWKGLADWITDYVRSCDQCQHSKFPRHAKYGLLQPLEVHYAASSSISTSSFSSAPPPAIEISTPWEIIVRVSSASDLPRPWQMLAGLSRLHLFPLSWAFGLPSRGLWIPLWFRSSSFVLVFLPFTPHFATRLA